MADATKETEAAARAPSPAGAVKSGLATMGSAIMNTSSGALAGVATATDTMNTKRKETMSKLSDQMSRPALPFARRRDETPAEALALLESAKQEREARRGAPRRAAPYGGQNFPTRVDSTAPRANFAGGHLVDPEAEG